MIDQLPSKRRDSSDVYVLFSEVHFGAAPLFSLFFPTRDEQDRHAVPIAATLQTGALVLRRVSHAYLSGTATLIARRIIGRSINMNANYVPLNYATGPL